MHELIALTRAGWLSATSYRFGLVVSLAGVLVGIVPIYFVTSAIQPVVAESISTEGGQYFAFFLTGTVTYSFIAVAVNAIPGAVRGAISSGTLEALLGTPARLPLLLLGFNSYPLLWNAFRNGLTVVAGGVLGAAFVWPQFFLGLPVLILIILAYIPFGLISAASIVAFRTTTPLDRGILMASVALGGVYYSTSVIPSWVGELSYFVPLTYGLRALRRIILEGMPVSAVMSDLIALALSIVVLWALGIAAFGYALRYARRAGTLSQY